MSAKVDRDEIDSLLGQLSAMERERDNWKAACASDSTKMFEAMAERDSAKASMKVLAGLLVDGVKPVELAERLAASEARAQALEREHQAFVAEHNFGAFDSLRSALALEQAGAAQMRRALEKIQTGEGPFSNDQLTFACNVIEADKATASAALSTSAGREVLEAMRMAIEALKARRERVHAGEFWVSNYPDAAAALAALEKFGRGK